MQETKPDTTLPACARVFQARHGRWTYRFVDPKGDTVAGAVSMTYPSEAHATAAARLAVNVIADEAVTLVGRTARRKLKRLGDERDKEAAAHVATRESLNETIEYQEGRLRSSNATIRKYATNLTATCHTLRWRTQLAFWIGVPAVLVAFALGLLL